MLLRVVSIVMNEFISIVSERNVRNILSEFLYFVHAGYVVSTYLLLVLWCTLSKSRGISPFHYFISQLSHTYSYIQSFIQSLLITHPSLLLLLSNCFSFLFPTLLIFLFSFFYMSLSRGCSRGLKQRLYEW